MFSIDNYMKEHRITLGESIQERKKIYLDTKYWGYLCDVSLGKNTDKVFIEIYNILMQLAKEKKIICPLSYRIYSELRKQKDIERFNETARIMELLSEGVMIISERDRIDYELLYFFYTTTRGKDSVYEPDIFVWSKALFLLGLFTLEYLPFLSNQENEYIQKGSFDEMWESTFTVFVNQMGVETDSEIRNMQKNTVDSINQEKTNFEHELKNPKHVYMSEIAGQLDIYKDRIRSTFYHATNVNKSSEELDDNPENNIQPIINMIYSLFEQEKMGTYLPTLDIRAKLHSAIRWNKTQNFKENDLDDIGHIFTALPYYNYFFTEKKFCTLIKEKNIKYDEKYSCTVAWEANEILEILKTLVET